MIKKLEEKNLINYQKYQGLELSEKGKEKSFNKYSKT